MNEARLHRLLVWAGPLFAVLFLALSFMQGSTPGEGDSTAKIMKYYDDHSAVLMVSVFGTPLACALLLGFVAAVRERARAAAGGGSGGAGATIMVAGAVLWAAGMLTGSMITLSLITVQDKNHTDAVRALNDLSAASWLPFIGGIAVFLVGAGITAFSSRVLPTWLAWVALVVGIVSLAGPGGFVGFFGAPLFLFVAGIILATRQPDRAPVA